jgi:hypothetical protein
MVPRLRIGVVDWGGREAHAFIPEMGKMMIFYLRPLPLPSTQQADDLAYLLKKVGSRGQCILPSTFGKIEVEDSIFENNLDL